jgi:hypothetical protein
LMNFVLLPALEMSKDYGECTAEQKMEFLYGVKSFIQFLESKIHA